VSCDSGVGSPRGPCAAAGGIAGHVSIDGAGPYPRQRAAAKRKGEELVGRHGGGRGTSRSAAGGRRGRSLADAPGPVLVGLSRGRRPRFRPSLSLGAQGSGSGARLSNGTDVTVTESPGTVVGPRAA